MTINTKKIFQNIISEENLFNKRLLMYNSNKTIEGEVLEARSEKNKNENIQFTGYFWKLGLDQYSISPEKH